MTEELKTKVLVVGGGPGGYVAAIRSGQLGLDTVLVESQRLGGTCLVRGCIPSKALIHAANEFAAAQRMVGGNRLGIALAGAPMIDIVRTLAWKDGIVDKLSEGVQGLLRKAKVRVIEGWGTFTDAKTCMVETASGSCQVKAEHVVLATGSEPVALPMLPFGGPIISSTDALSLAKIPPRLVVVGAGYIGLELGTAFAKLGAKVTVIEARDRILPLWDPELTGPVKAALDRLGVEIRLETTIEARAGDASLLVCRPEGEPEQLDADAILVTVGRRPRTEGWGLDTMAIDRDGPFVRVDRSLRTSMRDVWAIGDLVGEPMLAHKASAQGRMVAEMIAGQRRRFDPAAIPAICFTDPEIVSVGVSPAEAKQAGDETVVGRFPFAANGRALTMNAAGDRGFVRIVARKDDHRVLGLQAVGTHVSELSSAFVQALEMGALLDDIAGMIEAHPTLGEALHEAALGALGHAIHI